MFYFSLANFWRQQCSVLIFQSFAIQPIHNMSTPRKSSGSQLTSHSNHLNSSSSQDSDDQFTIVPISKRHSSHYPSRKPTCNDRILMEQLIQVNDLMAELKDTEDLTSSNYFGKYGKVVTSIVYEKQLQGKNKKMNYMAYITYENDLDAAMALLAMQHYSHGLYKVSCKFGTTRYCQHFLDDNFCTYKNCRFLHEVKRNSIPCEKASITVDYSLSQAKKKVVNNLSYFVEKQYKEYLQSKKSVNLSGKVKCKCSWVSKSQLNKFIEFPTIKSTLASLIQLGHIQEEQYQRIKESFKSKNHAKKQPIIFAPEIQPKEFKLQVKQLSTLEIGNPQIVQTAPLPPPKIKSQHQSLPYIFKRYLYPQLKDSQLSPKSKFCERYCREREEELASRKFYRPKKVIMNPKSLNSHRALNNFLHYKIMHTLANKDSSKSLFEFANSQTKSNSQQIKDQIICNLIRE